MNFLRGVSLMKNIHIQPPAPLVAPHEPLFLQGQWLSFFPERFREPAAHAIVLLGGTLTAMLLCAPTIDSRGEQYLEASFARALVALAATRGLDSAISLAQSSEISFSLGPGGSLGIGQALDPINDLVEQYAWLLLTSTTAIGIQRVGMQISQSLGWWLFVPVLLAMVLAAIFKSKSRVTAMEWGHRLFGLALFCRLAIPVAAWIDSVVVTEFLESNYHEASAMVESTTHRIEQVETADAEKPWYERYSPIDYLGERATKLYASLGQVGESIVALAIYFTISTIVLPLGTLWVLAQLSNTLFGRPR